MDTTDYERLKEAAEREHRLNMEAIERVRRMEQSLAGSTLKSEDANGKTGGHVAKTPPPKRRNQDSKSCCELQIADYFGWALFRACEKEDSRSLDPIRSAFRSKFEIFAKGMKKWY